MERRRTSLSLITVIMLSATLASICMVTVASAQTFTSLVSFNTTDGKTPSNQSLVQGLDGSLYGTTVYGGANGQGEVFKITPGGTLTMLHSFCPVAGCADGQNPNGRLVLVTGGNLYGTTYGGGAHGGGTVFKITPTGTLTTLYSFCAKFGCADGLNPLAGMTLAADGNIYGTTVLGGTGGCGGCHGGGTMFKISLTGALSTLHSFCTGTCADGANPSNPLAQGTDGNFYTVITGRSGYYSGYVLKLTPVGKFTVLHTFCTTTGCPDGIFPEGPLVLSNDGNFYGTAQQGGAFNQGTVFKVTTTGTLTTIHSFDYTTSGNLGSNPTSGVVLGSDGNFYGTTYYGGMACVFGCGTVFQLTPAGGLTTLHEFNYTDGSAPYGLVQATFAPLYGVTYASGSNGSSSFGTVFSETDSLPEFARLTAYAGKVGASIDILGQNFSSATKVTFDGISASFTAPSGSYITTKVPAGALTGNVVVTTGAGTFTSDRVFDVTPQLTGISPSSTTVGKPVTLTGVSLTQTSAVTIGGKPASFTVNSDTQVTATVPAGAKTGLAITVKTQGGTASKGPLAIIPVITSFSPTSGSVGTSVTINGNTFTGATQVTFGGVAATTFKVVSDTEVTATVPTGAVTGPIAITTKGGTGASSTNFTVN